MEVLNHLKLIQHCMLTTPKLKFLKSTNPSGQRKEKQRQYMKDTNILEAACQGEAVMDKAES